MSRLLDSPIGPWTKIADYPYPVIEIEKPFAGDVKVSQMFLNSNRRYRRRYDKTTKKWREAKTRELGMHAGVDFSLSDRTILFAPVSGEFRFGFQPRAAGIYAKIIMTVYEPTIEVVMFHLSDVLFDGSAFVPAGIPVALSGNTGYSTGPHLHLEVRESRSKIPYAFKFKDPPVTSEERLSRWRDSVKLAHPDYDAAFSACLRAIQIAELDPLGLFVGNINLSRVKALVDSLVSGGKPAKNKIQPSP